jgi:hypothetical protein
VGQWPDPGSSFLWKSFHTTPSLRWIREIGKQSGVKLYKHIPNMKAIHVNVKAIWRRPLCRKRKVLHFFSTPVLSKRCVLFEQFRWYVRHSQVISYLYVEKRVLWPTTVVHFTDSQGSERLGHTWLVALSSWSISANYMVCLHAFIYSHVWFVDLPFSTLPRPNKRHNNDVENEDCKFTCGVHRKGPGKLRSLPAAFLKR